MNHTVDSQDRMASFRAVASGVAAKHADSVDRRARFPAEVFDALRKERLLCWFAADEPFPLRESAAGCYELARCCASSGLIFAMHQAQLATLRAHALGDWQKDLLAEVSRQQWLIGSSTSEEGPPSALAPVTAGAGRFALEKCAPTISYGEDADVLLVTTGGCAEEGIPTRSWSRCQRSASSSNTAAR